MITVRRIPDPSTGGFITMFDMDDVVDVNPAYYYAMMEKYRELEMYKSLLMLRNLPLTAKYEKIIIEKARMDWQQRYQQAIHHLLPDPLKGLFDAKKKAQQILLKGFEMSTNDFFAFIIQSWNTYGYRYSMYKFSHRPKELLTAKYPRFIFKQKDQSILTGGKTTLTPNQLTLALTERREMIVNFFSRDDQWHCFFRTYKSIYGTEKAHEGAPHMHYLSDAWGYKKEDVLQQLSERHHHLKSAHIWYEKRDEEPESGEE